MPRGPAQIPAGFVVGAKAVIRAAESVRTLIVATDAPAAATDPVRRLAAERRLTLVEVTSSADLGRHCGVPRPVAAAAELRSA
jgi:ribosomal protein L7Ae-like RNA K-turn-binding protein